MSRVSRDWIVCNANHNGRFECMRCGEAMMPDYPIRIELYVSVGKGFEKVHARCKEKPEGLHCPYCSKTGHEPQACPRCPTRATP
jgi:hypothetical protein